MLSTSPGKTCDPTCNVLHVLPLVIIVMFWYMFPHDRNVNVVLLADIHPHSRE